jgi:hypothetical protein
MALGADPVACETAGRGGDRAPGLEFRESPAPGFPDGARRANGNRGRATVPG